MHKSLVLIHVFENNLLLLVVLIDQFVFGIMKQGKEIFCCPNQSSECRAHPVLLGFGSRPENS